MQPTHNNNNMKLCALCSIMTKKKLNLCTETAGKALFPCQLPGMYAANLPTAPAASACQLFTPVLPLATDALGHPSGTASRAGPGTAWQRWQDSPRCSRRAGSLVRGLCEAGGASGGGYGGGGGIITDRCRDKQTVKQQGTNTI